MSDDSLRYAQWADELIANHFNMFAVKSQAHNYASQYIVFIYLVALMKVLFADMWMQALVVSNIIFNAVTLIILLQLLARVTQQSILLVLATCVYIGSYDIVIWTKFILSDSLYLFISFLFFSTSLSILNKANSNMRFGVSEWLISFSLLVICLLTRPTAIPLIVYLVIVTSVSYFAIRQQSIRKISGVTFVCLVLLSVVATFVIGGIMADPSSWPLDAGRAAVNYYSERFIEGAVVHDRLETYIAVKPTSLAFAHLTWLKFINFFVITLDDYSLIHSVYNIFWFSPIYLFSLFAFSELFRKKSVLSVSALVLILLGFLYLYTVAMFTAVTLLDYDHRYRAPVLPILIMLATLGISAMLHRVGGVKYSSSKNQPSHQSQP